jgi:hypothetical protein
VEVISGLVMEWLIWCNELRKREKERRPMLSKVSGVVGAANGSSDSALYRYNGKGIYVGQDGCRRKKIARVSSCFLHLKILKAPFQATWSSGGVAISIVVVTIVVVIVVADLVSKEGGMMQRQKVINGEQKMNRAWEGESYFSFVRWLVRSFVHSFDGVE